jgi:hypothetical protein
MGKGIIIPLWDSTFERNILSFFNELPPRFGNKYVLITALGKIAPIFH